MKIVVIGLGSIAKKHIGALNKLYDNAVFYALRHNKNSSIIDSIVNFYSTEEIGRINPDFILISNPTKEHYRVLKEVVKFNIPLFIEKPLFSSIGEKEELLVSEIVNKKIPNYIACNLRFHQGIIELKKCIQGKRIEEVNVYCGSYLPNWRPNVNFKSVYSANKEMGGGVHIDLIHELDYLYWIFNKPNSMTKTFKSSSSLDITAIDYANYLWEYDSFCVNIILNYYRKDTKRTFEVLTEDGTYMLDLIKNKITLNNEVIFESEQIIEDTYLDQMTFFIEEVVKKNRVFNNVEEGYKILELCF